MVREIEFATYGSTVVHPVALTFTLAMGVVLLAVKRQNALLPFALVATLIPEAQRVVVASLDFNMVRVLLLFGWARMFMRGELRPIRLNTLDYALVGWLLATTLVHVLREGTLGSFVYKLGIAFDAAGVYFLFRFLIRSYRDLVEPMRSLAWISVFVACFMAVEWTTGRNMFSIFGGVSEFTVVRDGRFRCQGAFSHPIMAGSFGASLVPMLIGMWAVQPRYYRAAIAGILAGTFITIASASSGPVLSYLAVVIGWGLWPVRAFLPHLRWSVVALLTVVHFAREMPVWHLIGRLGDLVGGTGYHRYHLIDNFIRRIGEWWLVGTSSTAHWGWGLQDITNQYVFEGIYGGLLGFAAFVAVLTCGFRAVGKARRTAPRRRRGISKEEVLAWALGVSLAVHCVSFMSVTYFGQMRVIFYLLLALIASLETAAATARARARRVRARARRSRAKPEAVPAGPAGVVGAPGIPASTRVRSRSSMRRDPGHRPLRGMRDITRERKP